MKNLLNNIHSAMDLEFDEQDYEFELDDATEL